MENMLLVFGKLLEPNFNKMKNQVFELKQILAKIKTAKQQGYNNVYLFDIDYEVVLQLKKQGYTIDNFTEYKISW